MRTLALSSAVRSSSAGRRSWNVVGKLRPRPRWWRWRRSLIGALAALLLLSVVGTVTASPARADANATTGDESVSVPTGYLFYTGQTVAQVRDKIDPGYRLVDLHETSPNIYSFVAVANSGAYAVPGWWWYIGVTPGQVVTLLQQNSGRLISAERTGDGTMNVIMVSNTGPAARAWWWYFGVTWPQIAAFLAENNARLVALDQDPGANTFTAVMVRNTGIDAKGWWWYVGQTTAQVTALLNQNRARLVDLDATGNGTWNVVMVAQAGADNKYWKWFVGTSAGNILNIAQQTGYRVFDFQPYAGGSGGTVYSAVMIDNLSAENRRVQNIFEDGYDAGGLSGGAYGYYVKPIGGPAALGLQNGKQYEPASGIKALYNLYAERQVQLGNDALANPFDYWYMPADPANKDVCPLDYANNAANQTTTTLVDGLDRMMGVSDNRTTQGTDLRYGRANVNNYASGIGMTGTFIDQTVGCGIMNGGSVTLTLDDITKLYEGVQTQALLSAARAASFFGRMNGGGIAPAGAFGLMVQAEAAAQGKAAIANQFIANVSTRTKGGSYNMCFPAGGCNPPYDYVRSNAGLLTLPFKNGAVITPHPYAFGWWINDLSIPCAFGVACAARVQADNTTAKFTQEIFRAQVRAALQTW